MTATEELELIRSLRAEITALTVRGSVQEDKIKEGWVEIAALKKQAEHAQAYIPKLKAENEALRAQLTDAAIAERVLFK